MKHRNIIKKFVETVNTVENRHQFIENELENIRTTFNDLVMTYSFMLDNEYFDYKNTYDDDVYSYENVMVIVRDGEISIVKVGDVTYTATKIASPKYYVTEITPQKNCRMEEVTKSGDLVYWFITTSTGGSRYEEMNGISLHHHGNNLFSAEYSVDTNYHLTELIFFDSTLTLDNNPTYKFKNSDNVLIDVSEWVNKRDLQFPLTDKQAYEFELKFL